MTVGVSLSLVALLGLTARAATPAPAAGGGQLLFDSVDSASTKVQVSGELRTRWEFNRDNMTDFASGAHDHMDYVDSRLRLGLLFELAAGYKVFVQPQSRYVWGGRNGMNDIAGGSEEDVDSLDVYQAYVQMSPEIFGYATTLTVGRQEIALGSEMLLGNDTVYAGVSWDAVRLDFTPVESLSTSLFVAKIVENSIDFVGDSGRVGQNGGSLNAGSVDDTHLYGVWNTYDFNDDVLLDAYVLYLTEDDEGNGSANYQLYGVDAKIFTVGSRIKADKLELWGQMFDASAELAVQMGKVNLNQNDDLDVTDTFAFEWEVGWRPNVTWSPRFAGGMAWASGDDDGTDDNYNRFTSLFQDSQNRLGSSDLFVLENIRCWYAEASCKPMNSEVVTAGATYLKFNAFEEYDAQGVGGAPIGGSNVNDTADEFDVWLGYKLSDNADLKVCWAWVEPDDQIHDTAFGGTVPNNSPAHRMHATLVVKF